MTRQAKVKKIHMTPYPGVVFVTKNKAQFIKLAKDFFKADEDLVDALKGSSGYYLSGATKHETHTALVWWTTHASLAHEMAHVVFDVFDYVSVGSADCGNNEPFCYLLGQLISETLKS